MFKVSYIEDRGHDFVVIDGIKFTSRVLRINLEETYRVFPYIVTCGTEIDQWSKSISGFMESYWVDGIKEMALREATGRFTVRLSTIIDRFNVRNESGFD